MTGIKDTGSNYQFFEKDIKTNVSRSGFDETYANSFTTPLGRLTPYYWQKTGMSEDWTREVEVVASVINPPVVPLFSRQRIFMHEYWLSFTQLWKKAQIFFDKGHTDNQYESASEIRIPTIKLAKWKRGSLADMLGFNFVRADSDGYYECKALKFMAYLRIWRDMYCNKRIYCRYLEAAINGDYAIPNPLYGETGHSNVNLTSAQITKIYNFMFPLDDADFRIDTPQWNDLKDDDEIIQYLFGEMKYRDYVDDYFTSATLEPIFGEIPLINGTVLGDTLFERVAGVGGDSGLSNLDSASGLLGFGNKTISGGSKKQLGLFSLGSSPSITASHFQQQGGTNNYFGTGRDFSGTTNDIRLFSSGSDYQQGHLNGSAPSQNTSLDYDDFIDAFNNTMRLKVKDLATSFTIDQIRQAESATIILEKLAKTDGSYKQWAEIMFGENPKSAYDYRPTYIGGTYQPIIYNQVVNTAGTTNKMQGDITGRGIGSGKGFIGRHHSDDEGFIIGIMSIMPDTYYCQGLERTDTYETAEDFYLPDRQELGKQAILNKEIYNDPQSEYNNDVFGWQNRFDEMRYRQNEVHCELADPDDKVFSPYIQTRFFNERPTLSPEFLTTKDNINENWLSVEEHLMTPFIVQVGNITHGVRPISYRAEAATFGM